MKKQLTRRDAIRVGSVIFANGALGTLNTILLGCGSGGTPTTTSTSSSSSGTDTGSSGSSSSSCEKATNVTRGPYFVDNIDDPNITNDDVDTTIPERADITTDSKGTGGTQAGLPLALTIYVGAYSSSGCSAIENAQIHIWHCNAQGVYSDVKASTNDNNADLTEENFLRGYQYTDADGKVTFTTIYPGWYSGRAVHIHVKVRIFNSSDTVTTEATTQLFFEDTTSTAVYAANSTYKSTTRDTLNTADSIYESEDPALLVSLSGDTANGYTGTVSIGITEGTIYGG